MKKSLLTSLAFAAITFMASCTKDATTPSSSWTYKGKTYNASYTGQVYQGDDLFLLAQVEQYKSAGSFQIRFTQPPTNGKTYNIAYNSPFDSNSVLVWVISADNISDVGMRGNIKVEYINSKLTATFKDVVIAKSFLSSDSIGSVTGKLIEQ